MNVLTVEDIEFHPLSATEWRVLDNRHPRHSIEALLGFVARQDSTFYATRMHHPLDAEQCASLDAVARFFVSTVERESQPGAMVSASRR